MLIRMSNYNTKDFERRKAHMKPWKEVGLGNFTLFVVAVPIMIGVFVVVSPVIAFLFIGKSWEQYKKNVIKRQSLSEAHKRASRREA